MLNFPEDKVFGSKTAGDLEGAKDVTMTWQEHQPNPHAKPGPDFKAMNKLSAIKGLTSVKEVPSFRQSHALTLKKRETLSKAPLLPSDKDPTFTYGEPASHRTAEQMRWQGATETPIKYLVQGMFQHDWIQMNTDRQANAQKTKAYFKPIPTKATLGHAKGAQEVQAAQTPAAYNTSQWKMTKFTKVPPKVTEYMSRSNRCDKLEIGDHAETCNDAQEEAVASS